MGVKKSNAERAGWGHMSSNKTMVPSAAFRDLPITLHSSGPDHAKVVCPFLRHCTNKAFELVFSR